jgi:hypothetical protein
VIDIDNLDDEVLNLVIEIDNLDDEVLNRVKGIDNLDDEVLNLVKRGKTRFSRARTLCGEYVQYLSRYDKALELYRAAAARLKKSSRGAQKSLVCSTECTEKTLESLCLCGDKPFYAASRNLTSGFSFSA